MTCTGPKGLKVDKDDILNRNPGWS